MGCAIVQSNVVGLPTLQTWRPCELTQQQQQPGCTALLDKLCLTVRQILRLTVSSAA
jgi:hypothetical protein